METGKPIKRPRVVLFGSLDARPDLKPMVDRLIRKIEDEVKVVGAFLQGEAWEPPRSGFDFAIVFGGDGSILRAGRQLAELQTPVIGVNLGKLGFLANVQPYGLNAAIEDIRSGNYRILNHVMLDCDVQLKKKSVGKSVALNEVSVLSGPPFHIIEIDLYVNGRLAASYNGDGLIISTPVGSTAHNLSAGGPIVRKDLSAVVLSPINPHTLTLRPIVDTADQDFKLKVRESNHASVVVDGVVISALTPDHCVHITKSDCQFRMIEVATNDYYQTLREKLGWGVGFSSNQAVPSKGKRKR
jgi:NAD+ kinase